MAIRGSVTPPVVPLVPKAAPVKDDRPAPITEGTSALAPEHEEALLEGTFEPMELVKIDPATIQTVFTDRAQLDPILAGIATAARSIISDPRTAKGRKEIVSRAYSIAKAKTYLDGLGKKLVDDLKELPKQVDTHRKHLRDFLDSLRDEVRKPVDEIEAEEARIEAERLAAESAAVLARGIESDHEIALVLNRAYDRERQDEFEALERASQLREEEIAREAQEKERLASAQREANLKAAAEKAKQDKADAQRRQQEAEAREAQAKIDSEAARVKAEQDAKERAEQAGILARQQEQQRQEAARKKEADELAARERNAKHRQKIHAEAKEALVLAGIAPEVAVIVITAIRDSKVPHLSIQY